MLLNVSGSSSRSECIPGERLLFLPFRVQQEDPVAQRGSVLRILRKNEICGLLRALPVACAILRDRKQIPCAPGGRHLVQVLFEQPDGDLRLARIEQMFCPGTDRQRVKILVIRNARCLRERIVVIQHVKKIFGVIGIGAVRIKPQIRFQALGGIVELVHAEIIARNAEKAFRRRFIHADI